MTSRDLSGRSDDLDEETTPRVSKPHSHVHEGNFTTVVSNSRVLKSLSRQLKPAVCLPVCV